MAAMPCMRTTWRPTRRPSHPPCLCPCLCSCVTTHGSFIRRQATNAHGSLALSSLFVISSPLSSFLFCFFYIAFLFCVQHSLQRGSGCSLGHSQNARSRAHPGGLVGATPTLPPLPSGIHGGAYTPRTNPPSATLQGSTVRAIGGGWPLATP